VRTDARRATLPVFAARWRHAGMRARYCAFCCRVILLRWRRYSHAMRHVCLPRCCAFTLSCLLFDDMPRARAERTAIFTMLILLYAFAGCAI